MHNIYELTASLFMNDCLRVDSGVKNRHAEYDRDKAFFAKNPSRLAYFRRNVPGELDLDLPIGQWLFAPALWLYVSRLSDTHVVLPVYRGKQFWTDPKTDSDVAIILIEMSNRGGIDKREWAEFEQKIIAAECEAIAKSASTNTVN